MSPKGLERAETVLVVIETMLVCGLKMVYRVLREE
jgi:hypothetical protein